MNLHFRALEEHRKLHQEHMGHEQMHAEMIIIFLVVLFIVQIILIEWKRRFYKSYMVSYQYPLCCTVLKTKTNIQPLKYFSL